MLLLKKYQDKIIFGIIVFALIIRAISSFPLDEKLLGGTDVSSHLFKVWYIAKYGLDKWNKFWYAGYPFLRYYAPLSYWISGFLGKFFGYLIAYKLIIDLFYILLPIPFYFLVKDFKLNQKTIIISFLIFSLIVIYPYYLFDGRHPALISTFFAITFWYFLKRTIDTGKLKYKLLSVISLALTGLTHHFLIFLILPVTLCWLIGYDFRKKNIINFLSIVFLSSLIVSWWFIPFLTEKSVIAEKSIIELSPIESASRVSTQVFLANYASDFFAFTWSQYAITLSIFFLGILVLFSLLSWKDKVVKGFLFSLLVVLILFFVLNYKRSLILVPIPLSILVGIALQNIDRKFILSPFLLIILLISFFSLKAITYSYPDVPSLPSDGRVMYLPAGVAFQEANEKGKLMFEALLVPTAGNEYILGWYPESQSVEKTKFNELVANPFQKNYSFYLRSGWVNYIVVNKRFENIVNLFKENENFKQINETKLFYIFELQPKSTYVEINNNPVSVNVTRGRDEIYINFYCKDGEILIKESYHPKWKAFLNGEELTLRNNNFGFIITHIEKNEGNCSLVLHFKS
jgi:hypothetical protein